MDDSAVWDFVDSPVIATLHSADDEVFAVDALDEPPRTLCDHGTLRSLR